MARPVVRLPPFSQRIRSVLLLRSGICVSVTPLSRLLLYVTLLLSACCGSLCQRIFPNLCLLHTRIPHPHFSCRFLMLRAGSFLAWIRNCSLKTAVQTVGSVLVWLLVGWPGLLLSVSLNSWPCLFLLWVFLPCGPDWVCISRLVSFGLFRFGFLSGRAEVHPPAFRLFHLCLYLISLSYMPYSGCLSAKSVPSDCPSKNLWWCCCFQ